MLSSLHGLTPFSSAIRGLVPRSVALLSYNTRFAHLSVLRSVHCSLAISPVYRTFSSRAKMDTADAEQLRLMAEECLLVDNNDVVIGAASKKDCTYLICFLFFCALSFFPFMDLLA